MKIDMAMEILVELKKLSEEMKRSNK